MDPAPPAPSTTSPKTSRLAIASLCLGISSFLILLLGAIPAIITGHIAQARIRRSHGRIRGDGIAIAGLICGYLGILFSIFIGSMAIIGFFTYKKVDQQTKVVDARRTCTALNQAVLSYYDEYARLPGSGTSDTTLVTNEPDGTHLIDILLGLDTPSTEAENPKYIRFFSEPCAEDGKDGLIYATTDDQVDALVDPWGNPYHVVIDYDYDDTLPNPFGAGKMHGKRVLTYSYGPNGSNDAGRGDDIKSW